MDLHYSQTLARFATTTYGFTTLWIYTILKHMLKYVCNRECFTTLWIYTILKPYVRPSVCTFCFTTLWIYTILKLPYQHSY